MLQQDKLMKPKRHIYFLLFVSILMLAVPLVPHHHHANGVICLKNDIATEQSCCGHQQPTDDQQSCPGHHHPENDACCNDGCMARMETSVPTSQVDLGDPAHGFVAVLFTDYIIENLLKPQERRIKNNYVYRESLHGTNITRAYALRGPPCLFV